MTDWNMATGPSQPLNRTGLQNVQVAGEKQGVLAGVTNPSGASENGLYEADASATADVDGDGTDDGPLPAVGALLHEEVVDISTIPSGNYLQDIEEQLVQENKKLLGDRATLVKFGIEMVNDDDDTSFTPGEPVYLDEGGGFTQDVSGFSDGSIVQVVGVALDPTNQEKSTANTKDRILLAVQDDYYVVSGGDATFSGDGSQTTFSIAHGLDSAPSEYEVQPTSAEAAAEHYVSNVDGTNIDVTFTTAPASGTDNVTFNWSAEE